MRRLVAWLVVAGLVAGGAGLVMAGEVAVVSGSDWTSPTLGKMKWIPAGTFTMGSSEGYSDETPHQVTLTRGFWLMEHEVTQGEWQAVMGRNPSYFKDCGATCPVEEVSWYSVQTYIQKVSTRDGVTYQLPTEAQWEYAARGGEAYIYAGSNHLDAVGWYDSNSGRQTHPGCQKLRNGYGLCDMSGNVFEWVQDRYGTYPGSTSDYVNNRSVGSRVFRGGSWLLNPSLARVANRGRFAPGSRLTILGFRLARLQ